MLNRFYTRLFLTIGFVVLVNRFFANSDNELDPDTMVKLYLDALTKSFGTLSTIQVQSVAQIISSFLENGDRDFRKLSYILATAWHESKFLLVSEKRASPGTELYKIQDKYWHTGYYGRGFVQLTHKKNYEKLGHRLGIDLVNNPDLAMDRRYSADILVIGMMEGLFTGVSLVYYINSISNYYDARRVVNGLDRAQLIADYAVKINSKLEYPVA